MDAFLTWRKTRRELIEECDLSRAINSGVSPVLHMQILQIVRVGLRQIGGNHRVMCDKQGLTTFLLHKVP